VGSESTASAVTQQSIRKHAVCTQPLLHSRHLLSSYSDLNAGTVPLYLPDELRILTRCSTPVANSGIADDVQGGCIPLRLLTTVKYLKPSKCFFPDSSRCFLSGRLCVLWTYCAAVAAGQNVPVAALRQATYKCLPNSDKVLLFLYFAGVTQGY
jgi:hypothetical protein